MGTFIIAEAGVNHNGSLDMAKKLVDKAKMIGADCVKFQTFKSELLVTEEAPLANYQTKNVSNTNSQLEMLKKLELSYDEFEVLYKYCAEKGIKFLSTPFDIQSAEFLNSLGMDIWKIPSGEITNLPLLEYIGNKNGKIILSTGMCGDNEVEDAVRVLKNMGDNEIILLHCTTEYPAPYESVNLKAMQTLHESFGLPVGYSDHTLGNEVAIAAVAMGACVIEKHFTLDKSLEGPDHKASLEPDEFAEMVRQIRNIDIALGDGIKKVQEVEKKNRLVARKSIVACKNISKGEIILEDMITVKRPGTGISPMRLREVVGSRAIKDFKKNELIQM